MRGSADDITGRLATQAAEAPGIAVPEAAALERTASQFLQTFDTRHGGFGDAPKFPRPTELLFLLREHARTGRTELRDIALQTLRAMAIGGMRDHVGGGFHRYSVDRAWRVPHFEKMLYDQAQLVLAYVEAAQVSGDPFFIGVADDTLRYVIREMTDAGGGFWSAEDADSLPPELAGEASARKMEGAFYLWRAEEIDRLFPDGPRENGDNDGNDGNAADVVKRYYGIAPNGNAPSDPQNEFTGKNILYVAKGLQSVADETGRTPDEVSSILQRARLAMFQTRLDRPRPHLDDKVLTAWNGLMIAAFARMARLMRGLGPESAAPAAAYLDAARKAASFIRAHMWQADRRTLLRRYRDGHAEIDGYAEDYAYLVFGLLELFATDPDSAWLDWAIALQERQDELFWDDASGGWFSTTGEDPHVLLRMKETYDGAEPTASSVGAHNLLTLGRLVDSAVWTDHLDRTLRLFSVQLEKMGRAVPMMAAVLSTYLSAPAQVVVVGGGSEAVELERAVAVRYLPHALILVLTPAQQAALAPRLPLISAMTAVGGQATAYVCRHFACQPPITTVEALERELATRN